jgi:short subunit dehydrogenase-like uncharacterized protein
VAENARHLDVVVFGATGVTGRQVAAYLSGTGARWGAAGRDAAKLERTLAEVGATPTESIAAELGDPESQAAMAARAKVVLNLVGPYTKYGRPVIEACVAEGAHYADLTGEIPFVREMVEEFDVAAAEAGVKLVQVCGFEALPPDLAVHLAAETAREHWDEELAEVDVSVAITGTPPGTTLSPNATPFSSKCSPFPSAVKVTAMSRMVSPFSSNAYTRNGATAPVESRD